MNRRQFIQTSTAALTCPSLLRAKTATPKLMVDRAIGEDCTVTTLRSQVAWISFYLPYIEVQRLRVISYGWHHMRVGDLICIIVREGTIIPKLFRITSITECHDKLAMFVMAKGLPGVASFFDYHQFCFFMPYEATWWPARRAIMNAEEALASAYPMCFESRHLAACGAPIRLNRCGFVSTLNSFTDVIDCVERGYVSGERLETRYDIEIQQRCRR